MYMLLWLVFPAAFLFFWVLNIMMDKFSSPASKARYEARIKQFEGKNPHVDSNSKEYLARYAPKTL